MAMTTLDVLQAVRDRLREPQDWTQGAWARDNFGKPVGVFHLGAVCWCLDGALGLACESFVGRDSAVRELARTNSMLVDDYTDASLLAWVRRWNDDPDRTHAEVIDLIDRTMARLQA